MSPITEISGCPAARSPRRPRSGPPRSASAPVAPASTPASPAARTPAAQITVRAAIRSLDPPSSIVDPALVDRRRLAPSRTVTPSAASSSRRLRRERLAEGGEDAVAGVDAGSPWPCWCRFAGSRAPAYDGRGSRAGRATSTPVGPPPTTTKVSHSSRSAESVARSACSKAPKIRSRRRDRVGERLQPEGDLRPLVVAEVGGLRRRRRGSGCRSRGARRGRARPGGAPRRCR